MRPELNASPWLMGGRCGVEVWYVAVEGNWSLLVFLGPYQ